MKFLTKLALITVLSFAFNVFVSPYAFAVTNKMDWIYVQKALSLMQGDWYDDSGVKVITINDKYINDCEVLSAYDFAGGSRFAVGVFRIQESTGVRDIRIEWNISRTSADHITINDNQTLHKTQSYFYESIGGFHLGMSSAIAEERLGKPTRILTTNNPLKIGSHVYPSGWYYQNKGLIITFNSKSIDRIILLKQSRLTFDKSGLNCSNTPEAFADAYSMSRIPPWPSADFNGVYSIGHGEFISFGKNMDNIMLTVYNN